MNLNPSLLQNISRSCSVCSGETAGNPVSRKCVDSIPIYFHTHRELVIEQRIIASTASTQSLKRTQYKELQNVYGAHMILRATECSHFLLMQKVQLFEFKSTHKIISSSIINNFALLLLFFVGKGCNKTID